MFWFAVDKGGVGDGDVVQDVDGLVYQTTDIIGLQRNVASNYVDRIRCY